MVIEKKFTEPKNYGDKRNTSEIKYIVIQEFSDKPTAHYHVTNEKAVQLVPDSFISNAVNGGKCCSLGIYHGICTKYNCISICMTDDPSENDLELLSHLIMTIKRRYKISDDNILRQSDVTGEPNPQTFLDNRKWHEQVIQRVKNME